MREETFLETLFRSLQTRRFPTIVRIQVWPPEQRLGNSWRPNSFNAARTEPGMRPRECLAKGLTYHHRSMPGSEELPVALDFIESQDTSWTTCVIADAALFRRI